MVVRAGREFLAIPGPTTIPDEVLRAMHRPATDIYSPEMTGMTMKLQADISRLFGSSGQTYIYIANGHGAWEAAISNVLSRGDKVLVLESGLFAAGWGRAAAAMGCDVEVLPGTWQRAVRPAEVEARLRADSGHTIKAIMVVQVDTAAGVMNDIGAIGAAIRAAGHPALFMVDAVASLGCMAFEMDAWGVDLAMSAAQKGLMGPPGLGFVVAGPRAKLAHQTADLKTPYWEWTARDGDQHYQKYAGTPPIHLLWALRAALNEPPRRVCARRRCSSSGACSLRRRACAASTCPSRRPGSPRRVPPAASLTAHMATTARRTRAACSSQSPLTHARSRPRRKMWWCATARRRTSRGWR